MSFGNFRLYINGKWVESGSGETFSSDNPARPSQVLGTFQKGTRDDINAAVEAAEILVATVQND